MSRLPNSSILSQLQIIKTLKHSMTRQLHRSSCLPSTQKQFESMDMLRLELLLKDFQSYDVSPMVLKTISIRLHKNTAEKYANSFNQCKAGSVEYEATLMTMVRRDCAGLTHARLRTAYCRDQINEEMKSEQLHISKTLKHSMTRQLRRSSSLLST